MHITFVHRGKEFGVDLPATASVQEMQERIAGETRVLPEHQKLLARQGAALQRVLRSGMAACTSIADVPLQAGTRITVLVAPQAEVEHVRAQEPGWQRQTAPRQLHPSLLRGARPRNTASPTTHPVFGSIAVHPATPASHPVHGRVRRYLERLAGDAAVLHVCRSHGYTVGTLTELLPHEHPHLLGLNENAGQRILLRVRTDAADGMRDYKTTRRVLMHELAHNEIPEHPPAFKILNSRLNSEVDAYERSVREGTHVLGGTDVYEPQGALGEVGAGKYGGGSYVLGGAPSATSEPLEQRRQRIREATEARLARLDQEIDEGCGDAQRDLVQ